MSESYRHSVKIVESNPQYDECFTEAGFDVVSNIHDADVICFTGGADVDPSAYGEEKHGMTCVAPERDKREEEIFNQHFGKHFVGICRGSQMLHILNGGYMIQQVSRHMGDHMALTTEFQNETSFIVPSDHHQQCGDTSVGEIILHANNLGTAKQGKKDGKEYTYENHNIDIEGMYYPRTKCLGFQAHPEYVKMNQEGKDVYNAFRLYFFKSLRKMLSENL
jgi:gamma-glutamyl-gamma-aminobutyrate hydrolase PuuD